VLVGSECVCIGALVSGEAVRTMSVTFTDIEHWDAVFAKKIRAWEGDRDKETSHLTADALLCEFLEGLGAKQTVEAFRELTKWYA
jgi:glucose-6-phosphate dehydrogenase assembly protein OpcA